jgi:NCS1 family nucleobase:cation symporter-1
MIGILPNIPGFLVQIKVCDPDALFGPLVPLYHYAWFIGLAVSGILYGLMMLTGQKTIETRDAVPAVS